jgi:hypothetical protein
MTSLFLKWLFIPLMLVSTAAHKTYHPLFVSVTEIEHNAKEKSLEVSCKIFTDDFEKALRAAYKTKVDLLDAKIKPAMDKLVSDYVLKHLQINVNGKAVALKFIGYERIEEGIYSYFEVANIALPKKIIVTNDILYEYKKEQIGLLHVTVGGKRQSTKLSNPEKIAVMEF